HAVCERVDMEVDEPGHVEGAAESDFAIALREVEIARGEPRTFYIDGEIDPGATRQVLDIAVAAVLTRRGGAHGLFRRLLQLRSLHMAEDDAGRVRRQRQGRDA